MKNMTNKQIYNYLEECFNKNFSQYRLRNDFPVSNVDMFEEEREGEKIYGYTKFKLFNFSIFLKNLTSTLWWFLILFYIALWALVVIMVNNFEYVLEELNRLGLWATLFFTIITIAYVVSLLTQLPKFIKNIGGCTIKHYFYADGSKDIEIYDRHLEN